MRFWCSSLSFSFSSMASKSTSRYCIFLIFNVTLGMPFLVIELILVCVFSNHILLSNRFMGAFWTTENPAFRWGSCRSKKLLPRLHLRPCPRLFPLPPRLTQTMITIKMSKRKKKSQCISWKRRHAIILCSLKCFLYMWPSGASKYDVDAKMVANMLFSFLNVGDPWADSYYL